MKNANLFPPPRDRAIWLRANVVTTTEAIVEVEPFEGWAEWRQENWVMRGGLCIRRSLQEELVPLAWCELAERAAQAPTWECSVDAHVYHWDDEYRREQGKAGYYALARVSHGPTGVCAQDRCEGPFATQQQAMECLMAMLAALRHFGTVAERKEAA